MRASRRKSSKKRGCKSVFQSAPFFWCLPKGEREGEKEEEGSRKGEEGKGDRILISSAHANSKNDSGAICDSGYIHLSLCTWAREEGRNKRKETTKKGVIFCTPMWVRQQQKFLDESSSCCGTWEKIIAGLNSINSSESLLCTHVLGRKWHEEQDQFSQGKIINAIICHLLHINSSLFAREKTQWIAMIKT